MALNDVAYLGASEVGDSASCANHSHQRFT